MNEVQIFKNDEFGEIRTIHQESKILFVATDVCKALNIARTQIRRLEHDEKDVCLMHTPGGKQKISVVNEAGLYNLVLASRKPEAKAFKRWITHEVIPAIRKTGKYEAKTVSQPQPPVPVQKEIKGVKYYYGVPVITKKELAKALEMEIGALNYYINRLDILKRGEDYFVITGKDLFSFKHKYNLSNLCTSLMLITEKGAVKLYDRLQKEYCPVIFKGNKPAPPEQPNNTAMIDEKRLYADIPGCKEIQEKIKLVKRSITALEELLDEYNRWNKKETTEYLFHAMNHVGMMLCCRVSEIGRSKYNLIPDPYLYPPTK